jgi:hypothetical protein
MRYLKRATWKFAPYRANICSPKATFGKILRLKPLYLPST